jgi:hypothetical protein
MSSKRYILTACALLSTAAVPAVANAAPTVKADKPCYVPGQAQHIAGGGFAPNGQVSLSYNESGPHGSNAMGATTLANAAGDIDDRLKTPDLASEDDTQEEVILGASNDEPPGPNPPELATTQFKVSILDAWVGPWESHKASPRKRTTFYGYGFGAIGGKKLYAHYVLHGKLRKTVAIGGLSGVCGDIKKKQRQFPFRPVMAGTYRIKLDATKKYPNTSPGFTYKRVKVSKKQAVR